MCRPVGFQSGTLWTDDIDDICRRVQDAGRARAGSAAAAHNWLAGCTQYPLARLSKYWKLDTKAHFLPIIFFGGPNAGKNGRWGLVPVARGGTRTRRKGTT
jgi:hypothetical protein